MNQLESTVKEVAKRLSFDELDTRAFVSLESFLETERAPDSLSDEQLKSKFLDFEADFCNLDLLASYLKPLGALTVSSAMNKNIITARMGEPATQVAARLTRGMITGLPVVDEDGRLCGVISATDFAGLVARPEMLAKAGELAVEQIMTHYPITVTPEADLLEVLHLMMSFRLHRIIVVNESKQPTGIMTSLDVAKIFRDLLKSLKDGKRADKK